MTLYRNLGSFECNVCCTYCNNVKKSATTHKAYVYIIVECFLSRTHTDYAYNSVLVEVTVTSPDDSHNIYTNTGFISVYHKVESYLRSTIKFL